MKILDLGCGKNKFKPTSPLDTVIGVDQQAFKGVDLVWNLEKTPYPFKNNEFDIVICSHILEHLNNYFKVLKEIKRICKKDGKIIIRVPHFSDVGAFSDPTHKRFYSYSSFDYFEDSSPYHQQANGIKFKILSKKILFGGKLHKFLGETLFQKFPNAYENNLCWIFPATEIEIILKNVK